MARRMKEMIVTDLERRVGDVEHAVLVDISRLTAEENRNCRAEFRKSGVSVNVVKNSLVRRVFAERGIQFPDEVLAGPTAIITDNKDAIGVSKLVADWRKKNKKEMPLKGGLLEGDALGAAEAEQLVMMPSVQETHQMLVSAIAGPLTQLVGITYNILANIPGVLNAIADKKKEEGE